MWFTKYLTSKPLWVIVLCLCTICWANNNPFDPTEIPRFTEFMVDTQQITTPDINSQTKPDVAFDGTNYFVVWEDNRSGDLDVYGIRVAADGTIIDPEPICIAAGTGDQLQPRVTYGGSNYFVTWASGSTLYGARVTPEGIVLDPSGIFIRPDITYVRPIDLTYGEGYYFTVYMRWEETRYEIYGTRIDTLGTVMEPNGIWLFFGCEQLAVTYGAGYYYVVFASGLMGRLWGCRVTTSGVIIPDWPIIDEDLNGQYNLSAAFAGDYYLITWDRYYYGGANNIYGARVNTAGAVLDHPPINICIWSNDQRFSSVASDGQNYFVVWQDQRNINDDIYGTRVDTSGAVLDPLGIPICDGQAGVRTYPSVTFNGSQYLAVWQDYRNADIYGARVRTTGQVIDQDGFPIVPASKNLQNLTAAGFDATNYLVLWSDNRNVGSSGWDIYGTRVNSSGAILDMPAIPVSCGANAQKSPSITFGGANYLAAWLDFRNHTTNADVYGARISPSGYILDTIPIGIINFESALYVATTYGSDQYFVVWDEEGIKGARVTNEGVVLDPTPISIAGWDYPEVGTDGIEYLVVGTTYGSGQHTLYGARVDSTGAVLGTFTIISLYRIHSPAIAFDGINYLITWQGQASFSGNYNIYASRITPSGTVLDPQLPICTETGDQTDPTIVFSGDCHYIAWTDNRTGDPNIYQATVMQDGSVIEIVQLTTSGSRRYPTVAAGADSQLIVAYQGYAPAPYMTQRIYAGFDYTPMVMPSVPQVIQPLNFARLPDLQPTISFYSTDPQGDDIDYQVIWDTDPNFASPESSITSTYPSGTTVNFVFPGPLIDGETYWWKVKARDPVGSGYWSGYSSARSFTIGLSLPAYSCSWYQTTGGQFVANTFNGTRIQGDSVTLVPTGPTVVDTMLIQDFEGTGIPPGWTVIDGNNDGYKWTVGTTSDIGSYQPPDYGTKYAYYSDYAAGSGAPPSMNEELISPAIYIGGVADDLELTYGYGYRNFSHLESFCMNIRLFSSGSWGSWITLKTYNDISSNGTEIISLDSYLPADSIQLEWDYSERFSALQAWACACDNVILTHAYIVPIDEGTMTSTPVQFHDLTTTYPRSVWGNVVWHKATAGDSIGIQVEYYDGAGWLLVPDGVLPGNSTGFFTNLTIDTFSINNLDTLTYNPLRVVGLFYRKAGRAPNDPALLDWEVGNLEDIDLVPPASPYVPVAEKVSGTDVKFYWHKITTDTLGNPETIDHYVIYRSTDPAFIPSSPDSIAGTTDTFYTDTGALISGDSYYYLVKAVDAADNRSRKSNMGYVLRKAFVLNPSATDKSWINLPWHSGYGTVSDLVADLSVAGDPLVKVTNLRGDQLYENYTWTTVPFPHWAGTDFAIDPGRGYETVTINDTVLVFVGSNNPDGLIALTYNPAATDKNWVSIPYNGVYSVVSDITTEYSAAGDPLVKVTNLRDDQLYENYTWTTVPFPHWAGTDFTIEPGRGYEFVVGVTHDTVWDPTEYTNRGQDRVILSKRRYPDLEVTMGTLVSADRAPVWSLEDKTVDLLSSSKPRVLSRAEEIDYHDVRMYRLVRSSECAAIINREVGISHVVHAYFELEECLDIVFTAYRLNNPADVLTERVIGGGVEQWGSFGALWFDVGNFLQPWQDSEEVILIIEAAQQDGSYFKVMRFALDGSVDIQELGPIELNAMPDPDQKEGLAALRRREPANQDIIGYSLYKDGQRVNDRIRTEAEYHGAGGVNLKLVVSGGYETVYGSSGIQSDPLVNNPIAYTFNIYPNPFAQRATITYALPHLTDVTITIYDVCGRVVKSLVCGKTEPGVYTRSWNGDDDVGQRAAAGVYFIHMRTEDYNSQRKIVFLR